MSFGASKPTIVLAHGAFQDCQNTWSKVKPELQARGYKVIVVTLPGRDGDGADLKSLTTELYRDTVLKAIAGETAPVVLVGHSFSGITISNVAEAAPDKIKALIYLSAYLPLDGQSLMDLAKTDRDSHMGKPGNLVLAPNYSFASINPEAKADIFANDADDADRAAIVASLIPEAPNPTRLLRQSETRQSTKRQYGRRRTMQRRTILIGISGASGIVYGIRTLELLRSADIEIHLVVVHRPGQRPEPLLTSWLFVCARGELRTAWAVQAGLRLDPSEYIITGPDLLQAGRMPEAWPLDRQSAVGNFRPVAL